MHLLRGHIPSLHYGSDSIDPIGDDGGEVHGSQEVSRKFVVASCNAPEILEPAKAALDNIAPSVGAFAEAVEGHSVRFVWNEGFRTVIDRALGNGDDYWI